MQREEYAQTSRKLLAKAEQEVAAGDLLQASEKLWGAAAHIIKAVAERRGWPHESHRALIQVVAQLARETDDRQLRRLFAYAQALHTNFYENWQTQDFVEEGVRAVDEFISKLESHRSA